MRYTITVDVPDELAKLLNLPTTTYEMATGSPTTDSGDPWDTYTPADQTQAAAANVATSDSGVSAEAIAAALQALGLGGGQAAPPNQNVGGFQTFQMQGKSGITNWTIGRTDAPFCQCRLPAAYVTGNTNGKSWARWCCPKGRDPNDKSKCKFNQFA